MQRDTLDTRASDYDSISELYFPESSLEAVVALPRRDSNCDVQERIAYRDTLGAFGLCKSCVLVRESSSPRRSGIFHHCALAYGFALEVAAKEREPSTRRARKRMNPYSERLR